MKRFESFDIKFWIKLSTFSFLLVAILGMFMRMKMEFELPWIEQKNWQHAHSHFAFDGWLSQAIWIWMFYRFLPAYTHHLHLKIQRLLLIHWVFCLLQLASFIYQAYGFFSISFSFLSLVIRIYFILVIWKLLARNHAADLSIKWAMVFHLIANLGTIALVIIQVNHIKNTDLYVASVYWYLHFTYNGWFFLALLGMFIKHLWPAGNFINTKVIHLMSLAIVFTYGLSVLWVGLPLWVYVLVLIGLAIQVWGWIEIVYRARKSVVLPSGISRWFINYLAAAWLIKLLLQVSSSVPSLSQFVFGARPIVIAYLHFVLLAFLSMAVFVFMHLSHPYSLSKLRWFLAVFALILLNQFILGLQGVLAFTYESIPHANDYLIALAGGIVVSTAFMVSRREG